MNDFSNKQQVDKDAYEFNRYCHVDRFGSYWHQLNEVIQKKPQSVLEIGVGDKVFANYLKENTTIRYTSADIAPDLNPDVITDIMQLEFPDASFDVVCAFEVLEHLQWKDVDKALLELRRVAKTYVIISLPHWGRYFSIDVRLPMLKRLRWQVKLGIFPIPHVFRGQHYWEIGKKRYPLSRVIEKIQKNHLNVEKEFTPFESPYHHFFILEK